MTESSFLKKLGGSFMFGAGLFFLFLGIIGIWISREAKKSNDRKIGLILGVIYIILAIFFFIQGVQK